jgi:DNA polymerase-3 subunit gamma/tau
MNLISQRPTYWSSVVGQQRALDVLQAVLRNPNFLTRGIILYGVLGVGKTTTAYLVAKALMCTGNDPLGCNECASCAVINESTIDQHPDFQEIDGAQKSGVEAAREIVEVTLSLPVLGRRKVSIIDEAQFLSPEAWGAYLKVLEQGSTESVFIFVSNEIEKIKRTTTSRCIKVPFERVTNSTMVGLLSKIATENNINYDLAGLEVIARYSKGIIRDAVQWLNTAAVLGDIRPDLVKTVIDTSLEDKCTKLLLLIASKDQIAATKLADEIGLNFTSQRIVEVLLSLYSRAIWQDDPESQLKNIYIGLPNVGEVTGVLIKWSGLAVPADVLPLIVYELLKTQQGKHITGSFTGRSIGMAATLTQPTVKPVSSFIPPQPKKNLSAFLEDEEVM